MSAQTIALLSIAAGLSLVLMGCATWGHRWRYGSYLGCVSVFFVAFATVELGFFRAGNWMIGILSFLALREYFSLTDLRLQDRLAVLGAYGSIPFMFHFVTIDWYGMFIISIPVYSFLAVPLLISLNGKETEGTVFSIGVIDFGLFLFVYCMGHISYLMSFSTWMAAMLILNVALCDWVIAWLGRGMFSEWKTAAAQYIVAMPVTVVLDAALSPWTGIPVFHSLILGVIIPLLVLMGRRTGEFVEADLGIQEDALYPGRGQILDNLKSLLFVAPVVFHYIRYFLK